MTTHSQGPWNAEGPDRFGDYNIHQPYIRLAVAAVVSNLRPADEVQANARLIAAAPNMLVALKEAAVWLRGWASAAPYLSKIEAAIDEADAQLSNSHRPEGS